LTYMDTNCRFDHDLLPLGKLPHEQLARLLSRYTSDDPRILVGPRLGEDATVIDWGDDSGDRLLVAKTDPITFATDEIGWYAVNVNANDVACMGATPRWFLITLLLPEGRTDSALVERIFDQIGQACTVLGVSLAGGHTEITYGLDRPIVVGHMLGEVARDRLVTTGGARVGDVLLLTKGVAVEATAIIAREKADELAGRFSAEFLVRCQGFLHDPGISVVRDARIATAAGRVHAMHDPTEGGLATGLWELAWAADVGLDVAATLPVLPETAQLCQAFDLDPLGVIASGALLMAVPHDEVKAIQRALEAEDIPAFEIGRVVEKAAGVTLLTAKGRQMLPRFARDEIARLF
jgi:hydrogenase expression/formation protein HypE